MTSDHRTHRLSLTAAGGCLLVIGALAAGCGTSTREEPADTPTTSPSSPLPTVSLSPTEKAVGGNNSFSPTVNPIPPGATCSKIVNGVCVR